MTPVTQQAHELLTAHVRGHLAIDATAGNGYDTEFLAQLVGPTGTVWAFDIQREALLRTASRLRERQISVEMRRGCIRPMEVLRSFCPLSPTIDVAFGDNSTVGERAGVRGPEQAVWPPHPNPLPRNMPTQGLTSIAGERGPEGDRPSANAPVRMQLASVPSLEGQALDAIPDPHVVCIEASHAEMSDHLPASCRGQIAAIMFNLGYLPGADKSCMTATTSTLAALEAGMEWLAPGGVLTVVVYPGHPGGSEEAAAVREWFSRRASAGSGELLCEVAEPLHRGPQLLALRTVRLV